MTEKLDGWLLKINRKLTKFFGEGEPLNGDGRNVAPHEEITNLNEEFERYESEMMVAGENKIEEEPELDASSSSEIVESLLQTVREGNESCGEGVIKADLHEPGVSTAPEKDGPAEVDMTHSSESNSSLLEFGREETKEKAEEEPEAHEDLNKEDCEEANFREQAQRDQAGGIGVLDSSHETENHRSEDLISEEIKSLEGELLDGQVSKNGFVVNLGYGQSQAPYLENTVSSGINVEDPSNRGRGGDENPDERFENALSYNVSHLSEFNFEGDSPEDLLLIRASREVCKNMASMMSLYEPRFFKQLSEDERLHLFRVADVKSKRLFNAFSALEEIITRQKHGVTPLNRGPLRLNRLLDEINVKYQSIASERGLEFIISLEGDIPARLATDAHRVYRILDYLIDNSFTFTADGRITLRIMYKEGELQVFVNDTGTGMSSEILGQLKALEQLEDLGRLISEHIFPPTVALVYCLVKDLSGRLEVSSIEKVGTCFSLSVPAKAIGSELALWEAVSFDPFDSKEFFRFNFVRSLSGSLIVVSTDEFLIESIKYFTKVSRVKLLIVESIEKLLRKVASTSIDLAMVDINSVGFDEDRIKQRIEAYKLKIPIVALTANCEPLSSERGNGIFVSYLQLPLKPHKLFGILCNYLDLEGAVPEQFVTHFRGKESGYVLSDTLIDFASELLFDFEIVKKQLSMRKLNEATVKLDSLIKLVEHYDLKELVELFTKLRQSLTDESRSQGLVIKIDWVIDEILRMEEDTSPQPVKRPPQPKSRSPKLEAAPTQKVPVALEVADYSTIEIPEDLKPLVTDFVTELDQMVDRISKSITSGVLSKACDMTQELLGAASLYGFTELGSILRSLLIDLERQETSRVKDRLEGIRNFRKRLQKAIASM